MAVPLLEPELESQSDTYPLLMEHSENHSGEEHAIDITIRSSVASSRSHGAHSSEVDTPRHDGEPSISTQVPVSQSTSSLSSAASTSRNASLLRRGDSHSRRRHRSPLNSGLWISIELVITVSQIIASVVVLSLSRHENPQAPLFAWVVGYASGCVATLPLLYWRYLHRNQQGSTEQDSGNQGASHSNSTSESTSYTAISVPQTIEEENRRTSSRSWFSQITRSGSRIPRTVRMKELQEEGTAKIKLASIRLCWDVEEDLGQTRGATPESIGALPTYKFKLKKNKNKGEGEGEGGIFAAGTNRERIISAEDAVCCICLARYADNDELRELPCSHFFHMECVDKWLKINALCPLCKADVGESGASSSNANSSWRIGLEAGRDH
ncbi:hypothetical protein ACLOJK_031866 [Asimina triloba]